MKSEARKISIASELPPAETFWERAAQSKWGAYLTEAIGRAVVQAHELSREPTTALEIGCEGGRWAAFLTGRGWDVRCTDVDAESLELCRRRVPSAECTLVTGEETSLAEADEGLDLVLCLEVVPVIGSSWFLREAARVLRPGGLMVCTYYNSFSLRGFAYRIRQKFSRNDHDYGYYAQKPYVHYARDLDRSGFDIVSQEGLCWFPFGRTSDSFLVPPAVKLERFLGLRKLTSVSPWIVFVARKRSDTASATQSVHR